LSETRKSPRGSFKREMCRQESYRGKNWEEVPSQAVTETSGEKLGEHDIDAIGPEAEKLRTVGKK